MSQEKAPALETPALLPVHRNWKIATIVAVIMVLLALLGVAIAPVSSGGAPVYWISLAVVYGILCVGTAWARTHREGHFDRSAVARQFLHWLGIAIALGLDFFIRRTGEESSMGAGFNALLLLALGCYLAGVHLDWPFGLVGVLLTVTLLVAAKADQYLWLIFLLGAVTIVVLIGLMRLTAVRSLKARTHAPAAS